MNYDQEVVIKLFTDKLNPVSVSLPEGFMPSTQALPKKMEFPNLDIISINSRYLALVFGLEACTLLRICRLLLLPFKLHRATAILKRYSQKPIRCFAVYPSLHRPTFLFELGTQAERYAYACLMEDQRRIPMRIANAALRSWLGFEPRIAAIIAVGEIC
jgi:hypothetical protein